MAAPTHIKINGVKLTLRQFAKVLLVNHGQNAFYWTENVQPDDYTDEFCNVKIPDELNSAVGALLDEYDNKIRARFGIDNLDRRVRNI